MNQSRISSTYVWKEWRDHRVAIVVYALVAPLLLALAFATVPGTWAANAMVPTIAAYAGFAIAALAFGADLVPGEVRRGRLALLARLPGDLRTAFVAKLAFFAIVLAGFTLFTYGAASVASALLRKGPWFPAIEWRSTHPGGWIALVGASWLFVVACWLPRGTLALPAMALSLAAWGAPVVGAFWFHPGMELRASELTLVAAWLATSGLVVAAASFVGGLRHGGPWRARLAWCVGPTILAFEPVWTWAGLLGVGGRFAFVTGYHDLRGESLARPEWSSTHALAIDLEDGSWRELGEPGDVVVPACVRDQSGTTPYALIARHDSPRAVAPNEWRAGFDTATARPLTNEQWKKLTTEVGVDDGPASVGARVVLLADGSRCFARGTRLYRVDRDGATRELRSDLSRNWYPTARGLGFESVSVGTVYDCTRERAFAVDGAQPFVEFVRAGRWIVRTRGQDWARALWDPERRELAPLRGMAARDDSIVGVAPDDRLLVIAPARQYAAPQEPGALLLIDPESGERAELALPSNVTTGLCYGWQRGFTPAGDLLLLLQVARRESGAAPESWIARVDVARREAACAGPFGEIWTGLLGCADRDSIVLVEGDRRILRAHFDGRSPETLFPR